MPDDTQQPRPWWWLDVQAYIAISLVSSVIILAFVLAIRDPSGDMFKFMVGGLMTTGFASIIGFYFGSSAGSKAKDDTMNKIAQAGAGIAPPPVTPPTP